ncbi:MAG: aminopeptidase P family N-terminal domain-containing protein, partial [Pelagibacteraceae bacterium]
MEKIKKLRNLLKKYNLDGYIIPKNNEFFGEYVQSNEDNLKYISNFTGSAGFAIILKKKNYIFVDGRYTIQAGIQCGNNFEVCTIPQVMPNQVLKNLKIKIGFDP